MRPEADRYRAFLLRVWIRERDKAPLPAVQDVEIGETPAFADLEQLNERLRRERGVGRNVDLADGPGS